MKKRGLRLLLRDGERKLSLGVTSDLIGNAVCNEYKKSNRVSKIVPKQPSRIDTSNGESANCEGSSDAGQSPVYSLQSC